MRYRKNTKKTCSHSKRTVHNAIDGDTIFVKRKVCGSNYIRIAGYNTPERYGKGYKRAKQQLSSLIKDKKLHINPLTIKRGRVIAKVKAGYKGITNAMKRRGY